MLLFLYAASNALARCIAVHIERLSFLSEITLLTTYSDFYLAFMVGLLSLIPPLEALILHRDSARYVSRSLFLFDSLVGEWSQDPTKRKSFLFL
ncbi:uncharacterized protein BDW43DRAFT_213474 [Aspergillus alliaceus]|uniref:uncharacterized protein n=1 Tax=Petromyces alliaceus TaxID=209559 RepID=UPI0012A6C33A|nr:uncharacterized protein BDW43DRAFT_213474 [Aspergillus alliaceus]KAB8228556.1 hypothetical protein BDW43DRAFT_213474 [Aspergillus alliaceus]